MGYIKLAVFDFDGTLFRSPDKPTWWEGGWWGNLNSLNEPCVPERPSEDWWNGSVVAAAKQAIDNPDVMAVLLTGRIQKFSLRLKDLLSQAGLHFDQVHLASGGTTESFKLKVIKSILDKNPAIRGVAIWEDRAHHLKLMADWIEANGRACTPHLITVAVHESNCQPPAKTASVERVAAKFKSKKKDDEGNVHYEYSDRQVANRHNEKAERVEKLRKDITDLRAKVQKDITSKDPATRLPALAVALMDETIERVGNEDSADEGHFGVTGWLVRHLSFEEGEAVLRYVGKSGVEHEKFVTKAPVVKQLKQLVKGKSKDDPILELEDFTVKPANVNDYLKEFEITAKDIRGFRANQEMCKALREVRREGPDLPHARKERDKILKEEFKDALEEVAEIVGHTTSILRSDYLVPKMEETFMKDGTVLSTFKSATKTTSEKEDEAVDALIKPSPKKKPPRKDLKKRRVDVGDPDLDGQDDDLSRNYKKVAVRVAMAVRVAERFAAKTKKEYVDQKAKEKAEAEKGPGSHKQKGDEARTEKKLTKRREKLFDDYIKGKTFTNPETKKKVQFGSLPAEEQVIQRKKLRENWDKKQDSLEARGDEKMEDARETAKNTEEKAQSDKEQAKEKAKDDAENKEESAKALERDKKRDEKSDAEKKKQKDTESLKDTRSKLRDKAKTLGNAPAFDEDTGEHVGEVLDSLLGSMDEKEASKLIESVVARRDAGIDSLSRGRPSSKRNPPDKEKIDKLKKKYDEQDEEAEKHTDSIKELDDTLDGYKDDLAEIEASLKSVGKNKDKSRGYGREESEDTLKARKSTLESKISKAQTEKDVASSKLDTAKKDRETARKDLEKNFTEYYAHESLKSAERNPLTFINDSKALDKGSVRDRTVESASRFSGMDPEDRSKTLENFQKSISETQSKIGELEGKLSSEDPGDPESRKADHAELNKLKNRSEYLDHDLRALELSSIIEGDEKTESSVPKGTSAIIKALHSSGVDLFEIVESGIGLRGDQPKPDEISKLLHSLKPDQMGEVLKEVDPKLAESWEKILDSGDEAEDYIWPFNKIKNISQRKKVERANELFVSVLTDTITDDVESGSEKAEAVKKAPSNPKKKKKPKTKAKPKTPKDTPNAKKPYESKGVDIELDMEDFNQKTASSRRVASRFSSMSARVFV